MTNILLNTVSVRMIQRNNRISGQIYRKRMIISKAKKKFDLTSRIEGEHKEECHGQVEISRIVDIFK